MILPFRLDEYERAGLEFDHLIVEIATNEQIALRSSLANFATMRAVLDWTVRWCVEHAVGVTFVTMPESASYLRAGDIRGFEVRRFLNSYAAEKRLPIFDGYSWLDEWIAEYGIDLTSAFDTPAHIQPEIAHAFGVRIAESIDSAPLQRLRRRDSTPDFEYVPLDSVHGWSSAETIERSTSLGAAQLLRLTPHSPFELELKRGAVVGTVHNAAASTAVLRIDGLDSRAKRMDAHPGDKLILTAWGMRTPIAVEGRTTLNALPVEYLLDLEHNHATIWRPLSRRARGVPTVELAGLIIQVQAG